MAGSMSRNKGKRGEREIIDWLQPIVDEEFKRVGREPIRLERNLLQAHLGGADVFGLEWMSMEVKRHETLQVSGWWNQCLKQCSGGQVPILCWRQNQGKWHVRTRVPIKLDGRRSLTATVDMSWDTFLVYFRQRLRLELVSL